MGVSKVEKQNKWDKEVHNQDSKQIKIKGKHYNQKTLINHQDLKHK